MLDRMLRQARDFFAPRPPPSMTGREEKETNKRNNSGKSGAQSKTLKILEANPSA